MVETEINIMGRQCFDRRLDNRSLMAEEVAAWENPRNARKAFTGLLLWLLHGRNSVNFTRQSKIYGPLGYNGSHKVHHSD
jgi:hypothetical protein